MFPAFLGTSRARRASLNLVPPASATIAPSTSAGLVTIASQSEDDSPKERDLLHALANGLSIDKMDAEGLVEVCTKCRKAFMASRLRRHIKSGECGMSAN